MLEWDYYYEPADFDEEMEALKQSIRDNVRQEIKNKISALEEENATLREVKQNWTQMQREHEAALRAVERELEKCKREAKRLRLNELFADFKQTYWGIHNVGKLGPKCEKCDEDRKIHFFSPSGKELKEDCFCSKKAPFYEPAPLDVCEIDLRDGTLCAWFYERATSRDDYYYKSATYMGDHVYKGEPFDEIKIPEWQTNYPWFKSEEEAQKYCDWLNRDTADLGAQT